MAPVLISAFHCTSQSRRTGSGQRRLRVTVENLTASVNTRPPHPDITQKVLAGKGHRLARDGNNSAAATAEPRRWVYLMPGVYGKKERENG